MNCHDEKFTGSPTGTIRWTGTLAPNGELDIARRSRRNLILKGGGGTEGSALPGCSVTVEIPTPGINKLEGPVEKNNYSILRLQNTTMFPITSITINWRVN